VKTALGIVAGLACAAFVACSAGNKATVAPMAPQNNAPASAGAHSAEPPTSDPRGQIEYYAQQIDAQRKQIGLPEAVLPMSTQPMSAVPTPPHAAEDTSCHAGASSTCHDVCTLSDSICDNSNKICKLADDLGDDEWAAGKCASAKQTCTDAHKRCCECS